MSQACSIFHFLSMKDGPWSPALSSFWTIYILTESVAPFSILPSSHAATSPSPSTHLDNYSPNVHSSPAKKSITALTHQPRYYKAIYA